MGYKDAETARLTALAWYYQNRGRGIASAKARCSRTKLKALQVIMAGGLEFWTGEEVPKCPKCGCDDVRLLEVNHLAGGGGRENSRTMYGDIAAGRRRVADLGVLCRADNAIDYLERKYPESKGRLAVVWRER